jgi:membrane protein implicated in regulation of membrane protease activity
MIDSILSRPEIFWFVAGLVLFLLELIIPGFVIIFFGVGAWITAIVCLIGNPGINIQIIIFALTSILSLVGLRRLIQNKFFYSREAGSADVDDEFTGKEAVAKTDIIPGKLGRVEFKGTVWKADSKSDIKEGQLVIILEKDNFTLLVEPKK